MSSYPGPRNWGKTVGVLAIVLCLGAVAAVAEETLAGSVEAGESGYEIPVEVVNQSADILRGVSVEVVRKPAGLVGFTVDPQTVSAVLPGETQTFIVGFDVAESAQSRPRAEISLQVRAATGVFDDPNPTVAVTIVGAPGGTPVDVAGVAADEGAEPDRSPGAPPVLRLSRIERWGVAREHDILGSEQQRRGSFSEAEFDEILSAGFKIAPAQIRAGHPVKFSTSAMRSVKYDEGSFCFPSDPKPDRSSVRVLLSVGGFENVKSDARGALGMFNYCRGNLMREVEWSGGGRYFSFTNVFTDKAETSIALIPAGEERIDRTYGSSEVRYRYQVQISGSAELLEETAASEVVLIRQLYRTDEDGFAISEVPFGSSVVVTMSAPTITNGNDVGLSLVYTPVTADSASWIAPIPFQHPLPFPPTPGEDRDDEAGPHGDGPGGRPSDEPGAAEDGRGPSGEGGAEVVSPTGEIDSTIGGNDGASVTGATDGTVGLPPDARAIDPNRTDISALIAQWVAIAEPPDNALYGSDLRYNEWGVAHGSTSSGIISPGRRPDAVGAQTSPEFLWSLKDRLDSVDHCTLGRYVEDRLAGGGPVGCEGRYMGEVKALQGRKESAARHKVEQMRWVAVVMKGDPAPSAELADTVQRQDPAPGTRLRRGQVVQLWIYDEPASTRVEVPDLKGQSSRLASAWLEELGLVAVVQRGSAAPTTQLAGKVERQNPTPGQRVDPGQAVTLHVFRDPAPLPPPVPTRDPGPAGLDCSRWPGSVAVRDPATGGNACDCPSGTQWSVGGTACVPTTTGQTSPQCPAGTRWDGHSRTCVAMSTTVIEPILPDLPGGCTHKPGTIAVRDPRTGRSRCACPAGAHWDDAQRRCVNAPLAPLEPRACIQHYADIRLAKILGDSVAASNAEAAARAAGCGSTHITEAVASGDAWSTASQGIGGASGNQQVDRTTGRCNEMREAGRENPVSHTVDMGTSFGSFVFEYQTYSVEDRITIVQGGVPLFDSGCVGTNGTQQVRVNLRGGGNRVTVDVQPRCKGHSNTAWEFVVQCP